MKLPLLSTLIFSLLSVPAFSQCMQGNCMNGYGLSFTNAQCDTYEGNWVNGEQQGDGIMNYNDGRKFIGQFRNNTLNGRGVLYSADGTIAADGFFENGNYIADTELKNSGSSYLETFKINRLLEKFNILEYPYVSAFSDAIEKVSSAGATRYKSISGQNAVQNTRGQQGNEGKVKIPGSKGCYVLTDMYMADYGEFSTIQDAARKFVDVCSQLMAHDKNFVILNDVKDLESPTIKRYLFYNDNGDNFEQSWMYLSIYEWKAEHKYFVELGCGFGAGKIMKVMPDKGKRNELFAQSLTALLNDADNSFEKFTVDVGSFSCTADVDPLYCSDMHAELPGLGKLKYISLQTSAIYKGVSGYTVAATAKEAEKIYQSLVHDVTNSLTDEFVYTEFGSVENGNLEIVFASLNEIHNDRTPVIRINVVMASDFTYQVVLSIQFDSFEIVSRDLSLAW